MEKHQNIPQNAVYNSEQNQWEIGERNQNGKPIGIWNYWWADTGHLCCTTVFESLDKDFIFSRFHPDGTYSWKGEFKNDTYVGLSYYQKSKNETTELVFIEEIYKNAFRGIYNWNNHTWQFFNEQNIPIDINGIPIIKNRKVKFSNPFGYKIPNDKDIEEARVKYNFSDDYSTFLKTQNGFFADEFIVSTEKENYLLNIDESESNQDFKMLYAFNAIEEYQDLLKNQEYNIFKDYFFIIGSDLAGNEFVEINSGLHKGKIGCIDHEMYSNFNDIEDYFSELELGEYNELTKEERYDKILNEDFGLIAFHANDINDFLENCFTYSDKDGIRIK